MAEVAALLVDRVIPRVPVRQWVLSMPYDVRFALARDSKLLSGVIRIWISEIFRDLRRRARARGYPGGKCGGITAVQRFGSSLNLNAHLHSPILDGVYVRNKVTGLLQFRKLPPPSEEDLKRVLTRVRTRALAYLAREGHDFADPSGATGSNESPGAMDLLRAASIRQWQVLGERPGPVETVGKDEILAGMPYPVKPMCAIEERWSVHAGVRMRAGDRKGLEKLLRYVLRPPFAQERLRRLEDGRVLYILRKERYDGVKCLVFEPVEFLAKLAALVPPPRSNMVRYHGVLAPNSRLRREVVPAPTLPRRRKRCDVEGEGEERDLGRMDWATLLKRSMDLDALKCPRCPGTMKVIAAIEDEEEAAKILRAMGIPSDLRVVEPSRAPPLGDVEFDQSEGQQSGM